MLIMSRWKGRLVVLRCLGNLDCAWWQRSGVYPDLRRMGTLDRGVHLFGDFFVLENTDKQKRPAFLHLSMAGLREEVFA